MDFFLSEGREVEAAKRFFRRTIVRHWPPPKITLEGSGASHRAVAELKGERAIRKGTEVRSCA